MTRYLIAALVLLLGLGLAMPGGARADVPLRAVSTLDAARYAGTWHEIARKPMFYERKCVRDVTATYTPREEGGFTVTNACVREDGERMESEGVARQAGSDPAKLEVRFAPRWLSALPFVWADYWVIAIDPDYQWAIVGEPGRDYLWFLSREPKLDTKTFEDLKARARTLGYKLDDLIVVSAPE